MNVSIADKELHMLAEKQTTLPSSVTLKHPYNLLQLRLKKFKQLSNLNIVRKLNKPSTHSPCTFTVDAATKVLSHSMQHVKGKP